MNNKKLAMAAVLAVAGLMGSSAMAAEWKHGMFPTDTLKPWQTGATLGYEYQYRDAEMGIVNSVGGIIRTYKKSEKTTINTLKMNTQLGLGYGLQLGVEFNAELAGSNEAQLSDGIVFSSTLSADKNKDFSGFYNPTFSLRWDLVKAFAEQPRDVAFVLEYGYKPKDWADSSISAGAILREHILDQPGEYGFDTHTVKAIGSANAGNSRHYLGYVGEFNGKYDGYANFWADSYPGGYEVGDTHSLVFGSEYAFTPSLSLGADFTYSMVRGRDGFVSGFEDADFGVKLAYKATEQLWIVPQVSLQRYGSRTYQEPMYLELTDSYYGVTTGVTLKAVF